MFGCKEQIHSQANLSKTKSKQKNKHKMKFFGRKLGPDHRRPAGHLQGLKPVPGTWVPRSPSVSGALLLSSSYLCNFQRNWIEPGLGPRSPTLSPILCVLYQILSHSSGEPRGISKYSRTYPNQRRCRPPGGTPRPCPQQHSPWLYMSGFYVLSGKGVVLSVLCSCRIKYWE